MTVGIVFDLLLGMSSKPEGLYSFIVQETRIVLAQMFSKGAVMLQPPKAMPGEDHAAGPGLTQPLHFCNRGGVVRGRTPILAVAFQERNNLAPLQNSLFDAPLVFVDEDEGTVRRNQSR